MAAKQPPQTVRQTLCSRSYPLKLGLRYWVTDSAERLCGVGETFLVSVSTFRISVAERLPVGDQIRLAVEWPVRLDGNVPLQLIVAGRIIESGPCEAVISVSRYEFHTARSI